MNTVEPDDYDLTNEEQSRWEAMVDEMQKERAAQEDDAPPPEAQSLNPAPPEEPADAQDELRGDGPQIAQDDPQGTQPSGDESDSVPPPEDPPDALPDAIPAPEFEPPRMEDFEVQDPPPTPDAEEVDAGSEYEQAFESLLKEGESWLSDVQSETDRHYNDVDRNRMEALIERAQDEGGRQFF